MIGSFNFSPDKHVSESKFSKGLEKSQDNKDIPDAISEGSSNSSSTDSILSENLMDVQIKLRNNINKKMYSKKKTIALFDSKTHFRLL